MLIEKILSCQSKFVFVFIAKSIRKRSIDHYEEQERFESKKSLHQRSVEINEELYERWEEGELEDEYDLLQRKEERLCEELMAGLGTFSLKIEKLDSARKSKPSLLQTLRKGITMNEIIKMVK